MPFQLFQEVALAIDLPQQGLFRGDLATIVATHPAVDGQPGYTLEQFTAGGTTVAVVTVAESALRPLTADDILTVRSRVPR